MKLNLKQLFFLNLSFFAVLNIHLLRAQDKDNWPILKHYDQNHLLNIALPLGGIGTGTVSLGGRGELRDWEIMNKPGIGYSTVTTGNNAPFFAVFIKPADEKPVTRALIGPVDDTEYQHYEGRPVNQHGFPRFANASFDASYPVGMVNLSDPNLPVKVKIIGFNPLVPGDADASGLPLAVLTYEVTNLTSKPMSVSVCGSMRNFVGKDGSKYHRDWKGDFIPDGAKKNQNVFKDNGKISGIYMYSDSVNKADPAYGTIGLLTDEKSGVSYRRSSVADRWALSTLDFWDDFSADGELTDKDKLYDNDPMASLAVKKEIAPNSTETFQFYITWDFPNRFAWSKTVVGNYYSTKYADAWDVAEKVIPKIPALKQKTKLFLNAFLNSSLPLAVKEAALFNLSTLRSQTVFRIKDGHMMAWEGVMDEFGSCYGSCTHVWNYEVATPFLYGNLAKSMRDVEFNYASRDNGFMSFRANLPLSEASKGPIAAADGQMGTIMKFYREWQLSGDNQFLKDNWPRVKNALAFAWVKGGWDGDVDGVMEGCQHNTMDVEYYGPNPQMQFWYLGALRAAEEMAKFLKDDAFAKKCNLLFKKGSAWTDANLFNGEYYIQKIQPPTTDIFPGLRMGGKIDINKIKNPDFQLGKGCLVDQLVGQYMAHICGLGYLAKKENIDTTLKSIMKYNYVADFSSKFNNMRSFVMGNESGLIMASWPNGREKVPFPYFAESMTGFEYTAAVGMMYEGQTDNALKCITSIRERFDGRKRNPYDEPECGHHYGRAMASWASVLALSGFQYSGVKGSISFTSTPGNYFWSNGYAWGTCDVENKKAVLTVLDGTLSFSKFSLGNISTNVKPTILKAGEHKEINL
ncbi:GH116 family glycosyl-hydrolase [Pedobacter segetis]|uniref:GH116 family glycosyl-hydrolase n=1 Tax=Pedobacter segetis TaxID=2793069 RepID=UPI001F302CDD|nr:GH116 family glycosyl-hydrolase [Pedobacter segetis]